MHNELRIIQTLEKVMFDNHIISTVTQERFIGKISHQQYVINQ